MIDRNGHIAQREAEAVARGSATVSGRLGAMRARLLHTALDTPALDTSPPPPPARMPMPSGFDYSRPLVEKPIAPTTDVFDSPDAFVVEGRVIGSVSGRSTPRHGKLSSLPPPPPALSESPAHQTSVGDQRAADLTRVMSPRALESYYAAAVMAGVASPDPHKPMLHGRITESEDATPQSQEQAENVAPPKAVQEMDGERLRHHDHGRHVKEQSDKHQPRVRQQRIATSATQRYNSGAPIVPVSPVSAGPVAEPVVREVQALRRRPKSPKAAAAHTSPVASSREVTSPSERPAPGQPSPTSFTTSSREFELVEATRQRQSLRKAAAVYQTIDRTPYLRAEKTASPPQPRPLPPPPGATAASTHQARDLNALPHRVLRTSAELSPRPDVHTSLTAGGSPPRALTAAVHSLIAAAEKDGRGSGAVASTGSLARSDSDPFEPSGAASLASQVPVSTRPGRPPTASSLDTRASVALSGEVINSRHRAERATVDAEAMTGRMDVEAAANADLWRMLLETERRASAALRRVRDTELWAAHERRLATQREIEAAAAVEQLTAEREEEKASFVRSMDEAVDTIAEVQAAADLKAQQLLATIKRLEAGIIDGSFTPEPKVVHHHHSALEGSKSKKSSLRKHKDRDVPSSSVARSHRPDTEGPAACDHVSGSSPPPADASPAVTASTVGRKASHLQRELFASHESPRHVKPEAAAAPSLPPHSPMPLSKKKERESSSKNGPASPRGALLSARERDLLSTVENERDHAVARATAIAAEREALRKEIETLRATQARDRDRASSDRKARRSKQEPTSSAVSPDVNVSAPVKELTDAEWEEAAWHTEQPDHVPTESSTKSHQPAATSAELESRTPEKAVVTAHSALVDSDACADGPAPHGTPLPAPATKEVPASTSHEKRPVVGAHIAPPQEQQYTMHGIPEALSDGSSGASESDRSADAREYNDGGPAPGHGDATRTLSGFPAPHPGPSIDDVVLMPDHHDTDDLRALGAQQEVSQGRGAEEIDEMGTGEEEAIAPPRLDARRERHRVKKRWERDEELQRAAQQRKVEELERRFAEFERKQREIAASSDTGGGAAPAEQPETLAEIPQKPVVIQLSTASQPAQIRPPEENDVLSIMKELSGSSIPAAAVGMGDAASTSPAPARPAVSDDDLFSTAAPVPPKKKKASSKKKHATKNSASRSPKVDCVNNVPRQALSPATTTAPNGTMPVANSADLTGGADLTPGPAAVSVATPGEARESEPFETPTHTDALMDAGAGATVLRGTPPPAVSPFPWELAPEDAAPNVLCEVNNQAAELPPRATGPFSATEGLHDGGLATLDAPQRDVGHDSAPLHPHREEQLRRARELLAQHPSSLYEAAHHSTAHVAHSGGVLPNHGDSRVNAETRPRHRTVGAGASPSSELRSRLRKAQRPRYGRSASHSPSPGRGPRSLYRSLGEVETEATPQPPRVTEPRDVTERVDEPSSRPTAISAGAQHTARVSDDRGDGYAHIHRPAPVRTRTRAIRDVASAPTSRAATPQAERPASASRGAAPKNEPAKTVVTPRRSKTPTVTGTRTSFSAQVPAHGDRGMGDAGAGDQVGAPRGQPRARTPTSRRSSGLPFSRPPSAATHTPLPVHSWLYVGSGDLLMTWRKKYCVFDPKTAVVSCADHRDGPFVPLLIIAPSSSLTSSSSTAAVNAGRDAPTSSSAMRCRILEVESETFNGLTHSLTPPTEQCRPFGVSAVVECVVAAAETSSMWHHRAAATAGDVLNVRLCATSRHDAQQWIKTLRACGP